MTWLPRDRLRALPKAELHCHLDGSIRPSTLVELAHQNGIELPKIGAVPATALDPDHPDHQRALQAVRQATHAGRICEDLEDYLRAFDFTISCIRSVEALERIAFELAEDTAAEGVRWLELRYGPGLLVTDTMDMDDVIAAVGRGLDRAAEAHPIESGQILCGIKHCDPKEGSETAEVATRLYAANAHRVLGFDFAGEERGGLQPHSEAIDICLEEGIPMTIHAGEALGAPSILEALEAGADRIGHGTRLVEDPELLELVAWEQVPLEVCLSSNFQTRTITAICDHPLLKFLERGVPFALATDNRLMSDVTLCHEIEAAIKEFDLGPRQVYHILMSGFLFSFAPDRIKDSLIEGADADLMELLAP